MDTAIPQQLLERPVDAKPYKGAESYQVEDAHLFFGRDREAEELVSTILGSRLSILHAPSGAGKSSLLNARVIPTLEAHGWRPIRVVPHNDPIAATVAGAFQQLLPPPAIERAAIRRLLDVRPDLLDATLSDTLSYYDAMPLNDRWRRRLVAPYQVGGKTAPAAGQEQGWSTPYFCRLLRRTISLERFNEHFRAMFSAVEEPEQWTPIVSETRCVDLLQRLETGADEAHEVWSHELDIPVHGLVPFFDNVIRQWGSAHTDFAIVVIIDQFEELFTRFVDRGQVGTTNNASAPDWRLKDALFDELRGLYEAKARPRTRGYLPIRVVLSLRNEYIAELDPIRRFVSNPLECSYHLAFLDKDDAAAVIREPARIYGYDYADECFDAIVADLVKENRYIEPTHIQVVCEKLWHESGAELAQDQSPHDGSGALPTVPFDLFNQRLGGTRDILKTYFSDVLKPFQPEEQEEMLDMLEPLITSEGTRNIVAERQLVTVPFRDENSRHKLLAALQDKRIVRIEGRLGGRFAEVTHEFLIRPILDEISRKLVADENIRDFRSARRALEQLANIPTGGARGTLARAYFNSLHRYRDRVHWPYADDLGVEIMLRNAITHCADREVINEWVTRSREAYLDSSHDPAPGSRGQT